MLFWTSKQFATLPLPLFPSSCLFCLSSLHLHRHFWEPHTLSRPGHNTQRNNNLYTGHPFSRGRKVTGRSGGGVIVPLVFSWSFEFFVVVVVVVVFHVQPHLQKQKKKRDPPKTTVFGFLSHHVLAAPKKNGWNLPTSNRWIIDPPLSATSAVLRWIHETLAGVAAQISVEFFCWKIRAMVFRAQAPKLNVVYNVLGNLGVAPNVFLFWFGIFRYPSSKSLLSKHQLVVGFQK